MRLRFILANKGCNGVALNNCCYQTSDCTVNINDECVCLIKLGGILALCDGSIYRRIQVSEPCSLLDFVLETFADETILPFLIQDEDTNGQYINDSDSVLFNDINGIQSAVSATNLLTIDGQTTYGTVTPTFTPSPTNSIHFYVNTTTNELYIWSPSSLSWYFYNTVLVSNSLPKADFKLLYRAMTATVTSHSTSTENAVTLNYLWSVTPSAGVTISTPTASSTNLTFTNVDQYTITLTITDSNSNVSTKSRTVMIDRIYNVLGNIQDEDTFATITALRAFVQSTGSNDFRTNSTQYRILINGKTIESTNNSVTHSNFALSTPTTKTYPYFFFNENGCIQNGSITLPSDNTLIPNLYIGARDKNQPRNELTDNISNVTTSTPGVFIISSTSNGYHNLYVDNIWLRSYSSTPSLATTTFLGIRTGLDAVQEYYFNYNVTGTYGGILSNSVGARAHPDHKDCRVYNCYVNTTSLNYNGEDNNYYKVFNSYGKSIQRCYENGNIKSTLFNNYFEGNLQSFPNNNQGWCVVEIVNFGPLATNLYFLFNTINDTNTLPQDNEYAGLALPRALSSPSIIIAHNRINTIQDAAIITNITSSGLWAFLKIYQNHIQGYYTIANYNPSIPDGFTAPSASISNVRLFNNFLQQTSPITINPFTTGVVSLSNRNIRYPYT